jgi:hypothetical protein
MAVAALYGFAVIAVCRTLTRPGDLNYDVMYFGLRAMAREHAGSNHGAMNIGQWVGRLFVGAFTAAIIAAWFIGHGAPISTSYPSPPIAAPAKNPWNDPPQRDLRALVGHQLPRVAPGRQAQSPRRAGPDRRERAENPAMSPSSSASNTTPSNSDPEPATGSGRTGGQTSTDGTSGARPACTPRIIKLGKMCL